MTSHVTLDDQASASSSERVLDNSCPGYSISIWGLKGDHGRESITMKEQMQGGSPHHLLNWVTHETSEEIAPPICFLSLKSLLSLWVQALSSLVLPLLSGRMMLSLGNSMTGDPVSHLD